MDWFESLTGFRERSYEETRSLLRVSDGRLHSTVNGRSYAIGQLDVVPLRALRDRVAASNAPKGKLRVTIVAGDVRDLHARPEFDGALFQVASQFNLLEMASQHVTPEDGVTRYAGDGTQGPACAIAAGAATIYRNYFAPVGNQVGQTSARQIDGLAELGSTLSQATGSAHGDLWEMRNGYAMCTRDGLASINEHLRTRDSGQLDDLRGLLAIGLHRDVEVTHHAQSGTQHVSQAFCSALPVGYTGIEQAHWEPFAELVLEAAYEATLLAAIELASEGGSNIVLLTRLGGGVFANDDAWIDRAMRRALGLASGYDLDVRLVSYGAPSRGLKELAGDFT